MTEQGISRVEEISALLRDEILCGQYRPGERLPSERDLAARFETNRGGVREALKKLEQLGIARITPGGIRVVPVEEASLSVLGPLVESQETPDRELVSHLLEVLSALMAMAGGTAVERATDVEIEEIQAIVSTLLAEAEDPVSNQQNWRELGRVFTQVSNNLVLRLILNGLRTQFLNRLEPSDPAKMPLGDVQRRRDLLECMARGLQERDARMVADAINEHFQLLRELVEDALPEEPQPMRSVTDE